MNPIHRRGGAIMLMAMLVTVLAAPRPAAAASGDVVQTATTTYQLLPSKHLVQVSIDVRVENHRPDTVTPYTCTQYIWDDILGLIPYDSTCYRTTHYYTNQTEVFLEDGATHLAAKADGGSVSIKTESDKNGYKLDRLTFSNIFNGQVRTIHLTYQIPGGAPRSSGPVRAGAAYASFCATGNGIDGGSVNVIVPNGFTFFTSGGPATTSTSASGTTYHSGSLSDPIQYYLCLDGTNRSALTQKAVTTADGRQLLIEAWPEDPTWLSTIASRAQTSAEALETLIGRSLPGSGPITIEETSQTDLGNYAGVRDSDTGLIQVSEDLSQFDTVAHELAHTWFNGSLFGSIWLDEGNAEWAATTVDADTVPPCTDPGPSPSGSAADLADWQVAGPRATAAQLSAVAYQYAAACYIVTQIAAAAGPANMQTAIQDMLDHRVPYLDGAAARLPAGPLTWRQWLDIVDEDAMVPAGADMNLAQSLVQRFGVASDTAELAARSAARQQYHEFGSTANGWAMPAFISQAMADWRFTDATAGLDAAANLYAVAGQIDQTLPGADAVSGVLKTRFEGATSLADLQGAQRFAQGLLDAAKAVRAADQAASAATGPIETVGLAGQNLPTLEANALSAVSRGDATGATARAASITQVVGAATEWGLIRIGLVLLVVVVMLGLAGWWYRRRRRQVMPTPAGGDETLPTSTSASAVSAETLTLFEDDAVGMSPVAAARPPAAEPAAPRAASDPQPSG